jgi:hypothetical protein
MRADISPEGSAAQARQSIRCALLSSHPGMDCIRSKLEDLAMDQIEGTSGA